MQNVVFLIGIIVANVPEGLLPLWLCRFIGDYEWKPLNAYVINFYFFLKCFTNSFWWLGKWYNHFRDEAYFSPMLLWHIWALWLRDEAYFCLKAILYAADCLHSLIFDAFIARFKQLIMHFAVRTHGWPRHWQPWPTDPARQVQVQGGGDGVLPKDGMEETRRGGPVRGRWLVWRHCLPHSLCNAAIHDMFDVIFAVQMRIVLALSAMNDILEELTEFINNYSEDKPIIFCDSGKGGNCVRCTSDALPKLNPMVRHHRCLTKIKKKSNADVRKCVV